MATINVEATNARAKACLAEVQDVLREHGFVLGHEDGAGAFKFIPRESLSDVHVRVYVSWLDGAFVDTE